MTEVQILKMRYGKIGARIERAAAKIPKKLHSLLRLAHKAIRGKAKWEQLALKTREEDALKAVNEDLTRLAEEIEKLA